MALRWRLSILGTKAAGKGTQIRRLVDNFNLVYFSPGEMFRQAAKKNTQLGLIAQRAFVRGDLVADDIVNALVEEWLWTTTPNQSIVFDGFPRTLPQAEFLAAAFADMKRELDAVIYLEVTDQTVVDRLVGRRFCRICRDEFHLDSAPFQACPYGKCEGQYLRPFEEDKPESVQSLIAAFKGGIRALLNFYRKRRKLIRVDGEGTADEVHARLVKKILPFR
ncbi:MAG: hypothetical protein FJ398_13730 [Verrucomicrobia bacterium]|nr:hypothetical protein [Verrucomicrobiota bacterium]